MKDGKVTIAEIGPRLKLIRQELGITQKQLAQDLDMNQAILSKFENGGMHLYYLMYYAISATGSILIICSNQAMTIA